MKELRKVVRIDEELCDGCGLCVPSCAEGAIRIIDGKARLVSETYCDGLGACLGECPRDAITIEEREAEIFDEKAVEAHLEKLRIEESSTRMEEKPEKEFKGCPGSLSRMFQVPAAQEKTVEADQRDEPVRSRLGNWPVQLKLAPVTAPYFENARLLISADCAAYSTAGFHSRFLDGRVLLIGCPKLDDGEFYLNKLRAIFAANSLSSIEVLYMEVPCCTGLVHVVTRALQASGKTLPVRLVRIGIRGEILETADATGGVE